MSCVSRDRPSEPSLSERVVSVPASSNGTKNETVKLESQNGPSPGATATRTGAVIGIVSFPSFAPLMYLNRRSNPVAVASS